MRRNEGREGGRKCMEWIENEGMKQQVIEKGKEDQIIDNEHRNEGE